MSVHDFRVESSSDAEEPAVRHPGLRDLVKAARMQPTPDVRVRAEAVHEGWQRRRATQRRGLVTTLAMAAAVVLTVTALGPSLWGDRTQDPEDHGTAATTDPSAVAANETETSSPTEMTPQLDPTEPKAPLLAATIHVEALDGDAAKPEVLGPRHLRLPDGQWSLDSETTEPVMVELPDGPLEIRGGALQVVVAGNEAHVTVLRTEVDRVQTSGRKVALPVAQKPTDPTRPSAADLAREAEEQMAAGDRQGAIRSLRRLVTRHERSAAAQAGLIDLGRLLKAAGQKDEARCAYAEFLERWPGHALTGDVLRAKRALGDGPPCDGLRPKR